jgi:hypothetical protein
MSNRRTGRQYEERIATIIGGEHMEQLNFGHSTHDVESDRVIGECKLRQDLAAETWMRQCETHAQDGKVCAVFCKAKGKHDTNSLVIIRLSDFMEMIDHV